MWFIGVEVEQEKSAPPPTKNPGSAPGIYMTLASRLNLRLLRAEVFNERKPSTSPMNACLHDGKLNMPRHECRVKGILKTKL